MNTILSAVAGAERVFEIMEDVYKRQKFSTASLVTRLTNDVNNMQMTLMMGMRLLVRAPVMLVAP